MTATTTTTNAVQSGTPLCCQAPRKGRVCGHFLGHAPSGAQLYGLAKRAPESPDGAFWTQCGKCGWWNAYRLAGAA